ncbi:peptidoglycan-binding protein [Pseudonocardia hispaniensis]|uniref:Peptidoglycan-binding protein n=1 Tax=Pseudonocardia hispaniensis TaxID=904933 RepID=A0ABW1J2C8_9PSEU
MTLTRRKLVLVVLAAVVVSSLSTALAATLIRSPAELAARAAPPAPTPILVPVEQRVITTKVLSRGTGRFGSPQELTLSRSALKTGPRVVTQLPEPGAELPEGAVAMTVSGRPVFLLGGAQPAYRDLGPGVRGPDVEQLEVALRRLGLAPGPVDGLYDQATGQAVSALYRRAGFAPMVATDAQLEAVRPVEAALVAGGRASGGVQLAADEVVFVPTLPVRVAEVKVTVGGEPTGALLTVTDSRVSVHGSLTLDEAQLVKPGMEVAIDEPALGITAHGTVEQVAERPGTEGLDGFHVFFSTAVAEPPPTLVGASVRMTVPVRSTGEAVLAVPVSAVSLAPDGSSRVQRAVNGTLEFLPVEPGVSGDGFVAVTVPGGDLKPGDQVVVGVEPMGPSGAR